MNTAAMKGSFAGGFCVTRSSFASGRARSLFQQQGLEKAAVHHDSLPDGKILLP